MKLSFPCFLVSAVWVADIAVAVLKPGALCESNWTSVGDYCPVGQACVQSDFFGDGWCTSYNCSTTVALSTVTKTLLPASTISTEHTTVTSYATLTSDVWCWCQPYVIYTTTFTVDTLPTATVAEGSHCTPAASLCQPGLDCVTALNNTCYHATCVNPKLPVHTVSTMNTITVAESTATVTATLTSKSATRRPGDPYCTCAGGHATTTSTYYVVPVSTARAM